MLHLLFVAAVGAYLSRRVDAQTESGTATTSIDYARIWQDLLAFFAVIGMVCGRALAFAQSARLYFDSEIVPWLDRRGIQFSLPRLDLPRLPGQVDAAAQ